MQSETTSIRFEVLMRFKLAEWFEKHPLVLGGNARTVIEHFELQLVVVIVFWNEYPLICVILFYFFVFAGLVLSQARALHLLVLLIPKISSYRFSSKLRLQNLPHLQITVFRCKKQPLCRPLLHGFIFWFLRSIHF